MKKKYIYKLDRNIFFIYENLLSFDYFSINDEYIVRKLDKLKEYIEKKFHLNEFYDSDVVSDDLYEIVKLK